jgi:uncharacterized protein
MLVAALLVGLFATPDVGRAQAEQPVPALAARVTDLAGALAPVERERIEAVLADLEQRTGAQVAVLIVRSTAPEDIAAYGIRVVEAWKLGRGSVGGRAVDDGVLLLVALDDRRVRIEVGRGLEGALPDAVARRIIAERIAPRFRDQAYAEGIAQAVAEIARRIEGEALPAPGSGSRSDDDAFDLGLVLVAGFLAGVAVSARLGRLPGGVAGGVVAAGFGLHQGLSAVAAVAVGLGVSAVVLVMLAAGGRGGGSAGRRGSPRGPVWTDSGGWKGSGGSAGGGFSGGGGSFGGGGASGDW